MVDEEHKYMRQTKGRNVEIVKKSEVDSKVACYFCRFEVKVL